MKLRTGGGGRKCGKHKTYRRGFWKCGNDWSYGRFFGSVANTGLSDILEEGRDQGRRGERYRAAGAHGLSGAGYRPSRARIAEPSILHFYYLSSDK